ncbi:hypothetical protein BaRGS_00011116, partial [Batillaria attramentaria]
HGGRIVGLAADVDDGILFWSDISEQYRAIYKSWTDGSSIQIIITDVMECNGLSVDWISNHIYWTDAGRLTVEIANYDGSGRRILIGYNLQIPRGIIVDPVFGYVFWADQGTKKIERAGLDGSERQVLVDKDLYWPNQLAVSYPTRRIYWVDAKQRTIASCDIDGGTVTIERHLSSSTTGFGLVVIGNNAIISTWFKAKILSTFVATRTALWTDELELPESRELFSLVSTAISVQPRTSHPCGQTDRGGCSHLCLPTRGMSYRCACPSYGGLTLSFSAKSCEAPSELLFFTLKGSGEVGFISLTGAQSHDLTLAGRSTHPSAVTYDPIEQVVYWSDVKEHVIYKASLAGGEQEVFLNSSDGIGIVDGLALDWVGRQLYLTNMGYSEPGLDGAVYSWHRIEMIALHKGQRKTVVTDVERPRGLDLDIENGRVILDEGLSNPNGLTFHNGQVYVADSNYNNRTTGPHLKVYNVEKEYWQDLKLSSNISDDANPDELPMGLAVRGYTLYYSDWISVEPDAVGYIKSYDLRFGVDNNVILKGHQPTGLHYSPHARKRQDSSDSICEHASCSHACVRVPGKTEDPFQCICPDESAKILASNYATCDRPENFLLYADLNTLQLVSLDSDTEATPHVLLYEDIASNLVALTYDDTTDTIYWSDLTRKRLYGSPFNDIAPHEVFSGELFMDGLAVDTDRQRLYFTGYNSSGDGVIARINLQRHGNAPHIVLTGLHNPRAIHLLTEKKLMFWTEYGDKRHPPSIHKAKISGRRAKRLISTGLFWPNALATHGEELYVGDGAGKVFITDFHGSHVRELSFLKGSVFHVYGLVVFDHLLFYSDWYTNGVYMVDMVTGRQEPVAQHLSRPTSLVIYHPANLTVNNQCQTAGEQCDEICVPVPRSYHCSCHVGSKLATDNHTCLKMESPWEVTESGRCNDLCDMNAYCAQLVPQLEYQCVCKAGYEGNGKKCGACGVDFYKPQLGNGTCFPCPIGSTSGGSLTASQCVCTEPNTKMVNNMCMDIITESTTEDQTQEDDMSTVTHGYGYFTRDLGLSASPGDVSPENASQRKMDGGGVGSTTASGTEQPFYEPFPGGDRDKPYFESCENREVFLEPDANGRAIVDVATARDGYGNRLPVISTIDIDNDHISLEWAKGTQQTVVLNAYDNWRNTATCQFQVLLRDVVPPVFTSCPGDVMKKTELASDTVFWPKPVAEDNSLVVEVTGSHEPNSLFSIGVTEVNYTAEDDSGNRADCRFTVTVILEQRCSLPTFKNGAIMCRTNWEQTYSIAHARKTTPPNLSASPPELCQFTCQGNHVVNPVSLFSRPFDCRAGGEDFAKLSALMKKQDACLLKKSPTIARQEFSLSFEGPCSPDDEALKQELRVQILDPLDEKNLCEWAECHHGNITIHCGPPPPSKRRSGTVPDTFDMRWNVTIQSSEGLSRDKVDKIFLSIKLELMNMAAMPITLALQQHFQTVANSVRMFPLEFTCQPGEMSFSDGCGRCRLCARGLWQHQTRQLSCQQCSYGYTREEGALSEKECVTFPPIDEMSKFLIITACTFGVVFLLMVIFMYLQYQRQQRQAKQRMALMASNPHRLPTPNVYASPPIVKPADHIRRSSLDYIGCHDYEDIDGASTATKAMLQALSKSSYWHRNNSLSRSPYASNRDSLHSFKGTSDLMFRIPPSPTQRESLGANSFQTSAETLTVQSSPRGSHRSFHMGGDGFYSKPPMSPGINNINSFKGSPVSPYKSLNFGRENGSALRTSPDSPTRSPQLPRDAESPYRLVNKTHDADSPYRLARESPYGRVTVTPSPFYRELQKTFQSGSGFPQEFGSDFAPDMPPEASSSNRGFSSMPESPSRGSRLPRATTDTQHSFKSMPDSPVHSRSPTMAPDDPNTFTPLGDSLYKRPSSPVSPMPSSRMSSDSLHRSPSTPRASPLSSRRRIDSSHRTPPLTRNKRSITENSCYEYE